MTIFYNIFCKWHQKWEEYDLKAYELNKSGTGCVMFLRCHLCNNYWIAVDLIDGIRDGIRHGYDSHLTKEQIDAKPQFDLYERNV